MPQENLFAEFQAFPLDSLNRNFSAGAKEEIIDRAEL
jgi:hypothetical protein